MTRVPGAETDRKALAGAANFWRRRPAAAFALRAAAAAGRSRRRRQPLKRVHR